ncbi:MAG TPA: ATP-binding cassette domain-containing protein [Microbacteriaceae bacterium]|nr:ATP-binding cassette domain-containing protein [Microbacteriaceae bacterium]
MKPTAAASAAKPANPPATEPEEAVEDAPPVDSVETTEASTLPEPEQPAAPAPDSTADAAPDEPSAEPATAIPVLELVGLTKRYGDFRAADDVTLSLDAGTFTGIVGPNGAGKTTTLSMITGLLRPTSGVVRVAGIDVWRDPVAAKRLIGVLPDRLHTFDRLTGGQLLYYTGVLHGLNRHTARQRTKELAEAFRVEHAMSRLVTDYSSGMLKKIALAAALIHAPRLLVLDEPFESVDPVSAMTVVQILRDYAAGGGTVLLSSHSMELVQRICDHVAVIVEGRLIAGGTVDEVRGDQSLQVRFIELAGSDAESIADLTWLHRFSS